MDRQAVELPDPHLDLRPALGGVVDGEAVAGRGGEARGGLGVEAALDLPGNERPQRVFDLVVRQLGQTGLAGEQRGQPVVETDNQGLVRQRMADEGQPGAQAFAGLAQRQGRQPFAANLVGQGAGDHRRVGLLDTPVLDRQLVEAQQATAAHLAVALDLQPVLGDQSVGEGLAQRRLVERRGQQDAITGGAAAQFADGDPLFAGQHVGGLNMGATTGGQLELAVRATRLRDPFGESLGQQQGLVERRLFGRRSRALRPAFGQLACIAGAGTAIAVEGFETVAEVHIPAAETALGQQGGDLRRQQRLPPGCAAHDHVRQPGRQRQAGERLAVGGQGALPVQRLQPDQQRPRLVEGRGGRRIEEGQAGRVTGAPAGQVERQARQIRLKNLRPAERNQGPGLGLLPQAVADARLGAAGAAPALVSGGAGDPHRLQPGQTAGRVEARHARLAGVDDHPHALDGQAGFRDGGGQHHLATACPRRADRAVLLRGVKRAVQRSEVDVRPPHPFGQPVAGAQDLALPRQEHQQTAGLLCQRLFDGPADLFLKPVRGITAEVAGFDGEGPALTFDHRRVAEQAGDRRAVERRRHHEDPQILAQQGLAVARQGQTEVGVEAALVEFVEQHRRHAVEAGIVLDHPGEDALGDHLDTRAGRDLRLQPDTEADRLPDRLAQGRGHARRRRPGRQPAGLQDDQPAAADPGLVPEEQGNARGLAGARRGDQHGAGPLGQSFAQTGQDFLNRQHCGAVLVRRRRLVTVSRCARRLCC